MNFFQRQEQARRSSKRLVLLFALAVLAIVAAVDLVLLLAFGALGEDASVADILTGLVAGTVLTVGIIGIASAYRSASLRAGGAAVALQMGGTPVPEDTRDFHYRRLRNVVEEIAIASGVPVPQVYVLERETAINAFAAGWSPADAAVAVTRGALDRLNRDELQGVIAHEFSHVLNGDMKLNIRLMGVLFGILVLGVIGRRILIHGGGRNSRNAGPVLIAALGLTVVGAVGVFFGRLIKAGVSRQREMLADASAVQFTRQTQGLAGALKKIAGLPEGSKLASADTEEVSHMLFGDGIGYSRLFATHPPLAERIRALDPSFRAESLPELAAQWQRQPPSGPDEDLALGLDRRDREPLPRDQSELRLNAAMVIAQAGAPQIDDYQRAGALVDAIPEVLRAAAHERDEAPVLLFGLLLAPPGRVRERQLYELAARHEDRLVRQAVDYADRLAELPRLLHLPLAAMAMPVLQRRPRPELERFMDGCFALTHADGEVSLFEYCLGRLLRVQVRDALDPTAWQGGRRRLADTMAPVITLMAVLAEAGHEEPGAAMRAFLAGIHAVFPNVHAVYQPPKDPLRALDEVWPLLEKVEPLGKQMLVEGLVAAIAHDNRMTVAEAELLRVVCASLQVPLPPMLDEGLGPKNPL